MSQIEITAGGQSVKVADDDASATALLGVALAAWQATEPAAGQAMGFGAGVGIGSAERSPNGTGAVRFRRAPLRVTSETGRGGEGSEPGRYDDW